MKMHELKPCPFCGGKATIIQETCEYSFEVGAFIVRYKVMCKDCRVSLTRTSKFRIIDGKPIFSVNGYDECVDAWNRRAGDETTTYKCDRCGASLGCDGEALEKNRFCIHDKIIRRIRFFRGYKGIDMKPMVYELCEPCRESLERWLNNENA